MRRQASTVIGMLQHPYRPVTGAPGHHELTSRARRSRNEREDKDSTNGSWCSRESWMLFHAGLGAAD